jgi:hypothetical protein
MASPSLLTLFVVSPVRFGLGDIALLALLSSSQKQNHEPLAILAEIHPVSRAEVDPPFGNAFADRLHIAQISRFDPGDRGADLRRGVGVDGSTNLRLFGEWRGESPTRVVNTCRWNGGRRVLGAGGESK